ncbi:MAG: protein translocase subunit SecD [Chloroflexota bacterium]|nr:protein translocase subunit SecD [Chloroflexota bacterium]
MRIRPWYIFSVIVVLTILATWIALPGQRLNVFNAKTRTETKLGLDLKGGVHAVLQARPAPGQKVDADVLSGLRDTIERRVNGLGVSEPIIQTQGNDKIVVELPGVQDPEAAVRVLKQTALLELVGSQTQLPVGSVITTSLGGPETVGLNPDGSPVSTATPGPGTTVPSVGTVAPGGTPAAAASGTTTSTVGTATPAGAASATPSTDASGTPSGSAAAAGTSGTPDPNSTPGASATAAPSATAPTGPSYETIVTGKELADAFPQTDQSGNLVVGFKLNSDAASKFGDYTGSHVGQFLNVIVDKKVVNSATIQSRIDQSGEINGLARTEVQNLVIVLKSGRLAVPLDVIETRTVGPTLGQDSINKSLLAGAIGLAAVAFFMIVFYRLPGVLAVCALGVYTVLTFAMFKLFGVVLTLAGIAGFILSIGMAVDANVLIFARMKEELRSGRTLRGAIDAGFDHAWPSIRDSNASTIITCLILYVFGGITGTSVVRGFALTLLIGVLVSLFSAITVTRTFLRCLLSSRGISTNRWLFNTESFAPASERSTATTTAGD